MRQPAPALQLEAPPGSVEYPTDQYAITGVTAGSAVNLKTGSAASTTNYVIVSFAPGFEASLTLNEDQRPRYGDGRQPVAAQVQRLAVVLPRSVRSGP